MIIYGFLYVSGLSFITYFCLSWKLYFDDFLFLWASLGIARSCIILYTNIAFVCHSSFEFFGTNGQKYIRKNVLSISLLGLTTKYLELERRFFIIYMYIQRLREYACNKISLYISIKEVYINGINGGFELIPFAFLYQLIVSLLCWALKLFCSVLTLVNADEKSSKEFQLGLLRGSACRRFLLREKATSTLAVNDGQKVCTKNLAKLNNKW